MQTIETSEKFWDVLLLFISKYNIYVSGFIGLTLLVNIVALIISFVRLSNYGGNPNKRTEVINEILICFVCFSILGGITSIYTFVLLIIIN